jgi:hypothetical protein
VSEQADVVTAEAPKNAREVVRVRRTTYNGLALLDALPPDVLQAVVREGIEGFLDKSAFDEEAATEHTERARLLELL